MSEEQQRSPEEIREDIEQTREELGDTAAAVAQKADVKQQAKDKVSELKEKASAKVSGVKSSVGADGASPESGGEVAAKAKGFASENPVPLAIGGAFVVGFALGRRRSH